MGHLDYDVVVAGASAAGLFAAKQLAGAGMRVAVYERNAELTPARRTLIVTPEFKAISGLPADATLHRITTLMLTTPRANAAVRLREPDLIVERRRFAWLLAEQAGQAGASIYFGHRFRGIEPHPEGAAVHFDVGNEGTVGVVARAVIGADGLFSDVARATGIRRAPTAPILQAEVELPQGWDPAVVQVWFDTNETRFFYWLVPESDRRGVVGLVGDRRGEARDLLERFLDRNGFTPLAYQGAQVAMHHPLLRPWSRVGFAPVYLVGDAAGQVKVTTVGGTVSGLLGAQAAARALISGTSYARQLRPLKRELDLHWLIRAMLERLDNKGYASLVNAVTPRVQDFLSRHNRDAMAGVFWRLLLLEPRLIGVGLRCLMPRRFRPTSRGAQVRLPAAGSD